MRSTGKRLVWVIAAAGAALLAVTGWWHGHRRTPWSVASECTGTLESDAPRAARVVGQLDRVAAGRKLLRAAPQPMKICFGEVGVGMVRTDGVFVLPASWEDAEDAARLGHLLLHRIEGPPLPEPIPNGLNCSQAVARALRAEVEAHLLEATLRRDLGVTRARPALAFEAALWAAASRDRAAVVERFLTENQAGPSLAAQYEQRCRTEKREAQ